jgi:hypothetical protein
MVAHARATTWGLEFLWGSLTSGLRTQLEAGGCNRRAFEGAALAAWRAWSELHAGPVRLVLRESDSGHELVTEPGPNGTGAAVAQLVSAAYFWEYRWRGDVTRLPMQAPKAGAAPDFWGMLPKDAQARLEGEGNTPESLNAAMLDQAREAIASAGGRYVPAVFLPIGSKKCAQPLAFKAWREKAGT